MSGQSKPLRFGVIGCGVMAAQVHCPNMAAVPDVKTAAFCDIDEEKAILQSTQTGQVVSFPAFLQANNAASFRVAE